MRELLRSTSAYRRIRTDAERGQCSHATLVVFPDDKYLRALLRECAAAFFGAEEGSRAAKLILEEHHLDCIFYPEAGGKLTAERAAGIVDESVLRPVEGDKKLFVLDSFHTATPLVQNKLLKVLEEPPAGVYFLLGAVNEYAVLPTVRSRVKLIAEPPFAEEAVRAALVRMYGERVEIPACAAACGGSLSAAENLLAGGGKDFERAKRFLLGEDTEAFCRSLTDKEDAGGFFAAVRLILRDVMLIGSGKGEYAAYRESARVASLYPVGAAIAGLALVEQAEKDMYFNANFSRCALALAIGLGKEREKWQRLSS